MRRKKANFIDIIDNNISYFASNRVVHTKTGITGTRFILDKPLTTQQREYFGQFQNVVFGGCSYNYASEIKHDFIIILDKCKERKAN